MPNILNCGGLNPFPSTEPTQVQHPNTLVWQDALQLTGVTKTATPVAINFRLKNYPTVTCSVVASGNVLNNVLPAPTGLSATGTSTTSINVVVSSIANQTAYRLLASDASAGTYAQVYQGATASFAHTGLTAGQTKFYKWQYVGGGFYDDSAQSAVFSGTAAAAAALAAYAIPANAWADGQTALAALGGTRRNTFASFTFALPAGATQLNVQAVADVGTLDASYLGAVGVFVTDAGNATTFQALAYPAIASPGTGPATYQAVTGLPAGARTVRVVVPTLARNGVNSPNVVGTVALQVQTDAAPAFAVAPTAGADYLLLGDSILGGGGAAQPFTDAVSALLRARVQATARVAVDSVAGGSLNEFYGAGTDRAGNLARVLAETATSGTLIIQYGTNDAGRSASTASVFGANYAQLVDDIHAARPDVRVVAQTPLVSRSYETLLETYRQQIRFVANPRAWLVLFEGPALMAAGYLSADNVHPTTAGHAVYEANLWAALNAVAGSTAGAVFKNLEFLAAPVADPNTGWVAGSAATTIAGGVATFTNAAGYPGGTFTQAVKLARGTSYRLEFKINSLSGAGGFVSLQSTGQNGQIHPDLQGAGTGGAPGVWAYEFVALTANDNYFLTGNGPCTAAVEYCSLTAIADLPAPVKNFDFSVPATGNAATGWVVGAGASISGGSAVFANATADGTGPGELQQTMTLTVGKKYRVQCVVTALSAGQVYLSSQAGQFAAVTGTTTGPLFSAIFTATAATDTLHVRGLNGASATLDYVQVAAMDLATAPAAGGATYYNTPSRAYSGAYQVETSSAYAGGAGSYTVQIGAYYTDTFAGTGLDISTPVGPGKGNADVYIDNVRVATVTATAGANATSQVLAVTNGSLRGFAPGSHTVKVVNLGGGSANVLISDKLQGIA